MQLTDRSFQLGNSELSDFITFVEKIYLKVSFPGITAAFFYTVWRLKKKVWVVMRTKIAASEQSVCEVFVWHWGSHERRLPLLQVVSFGAGARLAAEAHDEATLVDKVTCDVHGQQQEQKRHDEDPGPEHDAHGERCLLTQICHRRREQWGRGAGRRGGSSPNTLLFRNKTGLKKKKKKNTHIKRDRTLNWVALS